ncbi:ATPase, T2SS/T4P/T4SS family [Aquabacterium sp.]|uniref:GspE/PulE family protein n=1 Tax=Aquabacterium sp. TaxID=1872578 RepID=UPI0035C6CCF3
MSDTSQPPTPSSQPSGHDPSHDAGTEPAGFRWPTPPFASYPPAAVQHDHEPCEIVGLNGRVMSGRLIFFVPDEQVAHVQVPPARTTMPLRFNQFRSLQLQRPVLPVHGPELAESAHALSSELARRPVTDCVVQLRGGGEVRCQTIGWADTAFGLFLFPPQDEHGAVSRMFLPREAVEDARFGPPIGQALVDGDAVTPEQVREAVGVQASLRTQKLGDILLAQQVVSPEQLVGALEQQSRMPMVRIGEALIALSLITEEQLGEALRQQQSDRTVPLGELLVRLGLITRHDLLSALARKMGYPLIDLHKFPIDPSALHKVPFAVAARLHAVPVLLREGTLIVALEDPSQRLALSELEFITQCKVVPVLAPQNQLEWCIRDCYAKLGADVTSVAFSLDQDIPAPELEAFAADRLVEDLEKEGLGLGQDDRPIEQSDNSLVRLINTMIVEAHHQGVSDIHVESYAGRDKVKIRFRKDGQLLPYLELPHNYRSAIIARIKIMCDLDISEKRKPQDGKINFARFMPHLRIELRVATIPTNNGLEDVVMRLLSSARPMPLDKIGLSPSNLARFQQAMERPYGMVLCVGPTGSGKTTTLHSALSFINVPERKIWTAEDPVEITQPGLRQVQVNPKIDWTFAKALRALLRADPDVIMVGEMRDTETSRTAIEAALTGHLVLSTLHTNSAPETVTRLLDMGMDPFSFADSLLVVLAQRLVRRLCPACKESRPATEAEVQGWLDEYLHVCSPEQMGISRDSLRAEWTQRFAVDGALQHHHSPGCTHCNQTGFKARVGIHELMVVNAEIRRLIQTGASPDELQAQALREGMRTLRQDGIEKVLTGLTSMEEVRATSNI